MCPLYKRNDNPKMK